MGHQEERPDEPKDRTCAAKPATVCEEKGKNHQVKIKARERYRPLTQARYKWPRRTSCLDEASDEKKKKTD